MFASEPQLTIDDLRKVSIPVLVMVGDDDLIHLAHTCSLYESMPAAQLAVVPGTSHALPIEQPEELTKKGQIKEWARKAEIDINEIEADRARDRSNPVPAGRMSHEERRYKRLKHDLVAG